MTTTNDGAGEYRVSRAGSAGFAVVTGTETVTYRKALEGFSDNCQLTIEDFTCLLHAVMKAEKAKEKP